MTVLGDPLADRVDEPRVEAHDGDAVGGLTPRWLVSASLAYMALPTLIFVAGWTRPVIAVVAAACAVALVGMSVRTAMSQTKHAMPRPIKAGILGGATVMGLITGAGAVMPQAWDWLKHNAILRDLVHEPWPVTYEIDGQPFQLTYYLGYYLPAAAVGKVAGWQAANIALLLWTILGVGLAFTWFAVLTKAAGRGWILLVAALFSGPDLIGHLLYKPVVRYPEPWLPSEQLDWWAQVGKFPNHITSVMWGPHHAIGAWIGAGLILHLARSRQLRWIAPVVAFCGLMSPFVTIGLLPLIAWAVGRDGRASIGSHLRELVSLPAALAAVAVTPVLAYYAAIAAPLPAPYNDTVVAGFAITNPIREMSILQATGSYLLLIAIEVLIFYFLLRRSHVGKERDAGLLLGIITLTMIVFPLIRYGQWSDLAMRAVVPSMFVLSILVARVLLELPRSAKLRLVFLYLLVFGLKAPQMELSRVYTDSHVNGEVVKIGFDGDDLEATAGIAELRVEVYSDSPRFLAQYGASTDTFFSNVVARTPSAG